MNHREVFVAAPFPPSTQADQAPPHAEGDSRARCTESRVSGPSQGSNSAISQLKSGPQAPERLSTRHLSEQIRRELQFAAALLARAADALQPLADRMAGAGGPDVFADDVEAVRVDSRELGDRLGAIVLALEPRRPPTARVVVVERACGLVAELDNAEVTP